MNNTRILALLLTLVMVLVCVPSMADEKPIHISVAGYMFGPVDPEKDVITPRIEQLLKEKHDIDVDIEVVYVEQANYSEIINTRLAGDEAPDVFLCQSASALNTYYDQELIKSWSKEFFQQNAPDVYEFVNGGAAYGDLKNDVDQWWDAAMQGDDMIVIPSFKPDGSMPYKTLIYRGDWLEKLGVTEDQLPKTVDEFVALMTRFTKEDPDGNGKDDTYGCSLTGIKAILGAYGIGTGYSGGTSYWENQDDALISGDITEEAKEALAVCAKMYADGLIDPEFVAGTESISGSYWAISHGMVNGRYGASANASIDHYRLKGVVNADDLGGRCAQEYWAVNGEDSTFVYAPWPAGPKGEYGWQVGYAVAVSESAAYNANMSDEKLAVIFQILNAFATDDELFMTAAYGIEGEHYTVSEDGIIVRNANYTNEAFNAIGLWGCRSLYGGDRAFSTTAYDAVFYKDKSIANRLNYFKMDQFNSYQQNAVSVTLPSVADKAGNVNTVRDEWYTKFIRGEESLDNWDQFVNEYLAAGGDTLQAEANDWFQTK